MRQNNYLGLRGTQLKAAMMVLVVAPSFILFGYNNGSTGGIATLQSFVHQFPSIDTVNTKGSQETYNARVKGVVTGCYDLGAVVGSLLCIGYSDRIGRLRTTLIGLVLSIIGLAVESSAFSLGQFIVGRLIVGGAIGTISSAIPVWQAECSGTAHRGAFVMLEGVCISGGITLSEWVSFGFSFSSIPAVQWRIPLVFPVIFSIFVIPFIFLLPESPRWLARKGRMDEARYVLAALEDEDAFCTKIQEEMAEIERSLSLVRGDLKELATNGEERLFHRTVLAACGQMFQQMCGISALVFYTSTIFEDLGFTGVKSRVLGACLTNFQTFASLIPLFLIDRYGRRRLFMITGTGLAISTAVLAGTGGKTHGSASTAAVVFVFLFDLFYPIGFLGQTFLYATELAPLRHRVPITAAANATQWLCQFIVAQVTPPGTSNLGSHYWIIYAVLNAAFVPIVYFFFPETSGRSLEEMDTIFRQSNSIFDVVKVARELPRTEEHITTPVESDKSLTEDKTGVSWKPRYDQQENVH
ncbi:putative sugar transporter [Talaromyces proteolyticus]|uniref:Sugar transporter n=1 Tax=Talaromyces proteolyticus TaxID=1131652 RepID=A0AAD4KKE2_9EURO|nr:putative sugar transporter [Talaromyces proteolyticus]KAH8694216.1 putative sugar transporter [Talaromyces proteolyticus]